jgi:hypothetical protein
MCDRFFVRAVVWRLISSIFWLIYLSIKTRYLWHLSNRPKYILKNNFSQILVLRFEFNKLKEGGSGFLNYQATLLRLRTCRDSTQRCLRNWRPGKSCIMRNTLAVLWIFINICCDFPKLVKGGLVEQVGTAIKTRQHFEWLATYR